MTARSGRFPLAPQRRLAKRRENLPKLAVIGGRLEDDNAAVYKEMHRLAGGRIVVFATASSVPDEVGAETVGVFRAHGFDAVLAGVHGAGAIGAAQNKAIAELVEDYGSVYFTGGDQALITGALAPYGRESRVLKAIRKAHRSGSLVAGSSAGAAIMSEVMFSGGTSLEAATYGVVGDADEPGMLLALVSSAWPGSRKLTTEWYKAPVPPGDAAATVCEASVPGP